MPDNMNPLQRYDALNASGVSGENVKPDLIISSADRPSTVYALRQLLARVIGDIFDRGGVPVFVVRRAMDGALIA